MVFLVYISFVLVFFCICLRSDVAGKVGVGTQQRIPVACPWFPCNHVSSVCAQVIGPDHVIGALQALGFQEYIGEVKQVLKEYKEQALVGSGERDRKE